MEKSLLLKYYLLFTLRCCLVASCLLSVVSADTNIEQQVKVSFIYNFAKFVRWPDVNNADTSPIILCITGTQQLADQLFQLQNKKVNARTIQVRASQEQVANDCNILFVSESEASHWQKKLSHLSSSPILTISTIPNFVGEGGMIGLKVLDNRVRFDINLLAARKVDLSVNSQMASLANEVIK